ncbi:MAG: hypothetical protein LBJ75_04650 [Puniceicoccales bacterium]|nr:hypothetical protein [Puniceicoccales bacterium]
MQGRSFIGMELAQGAAISVKFLDPNDSIANATLNINEFFSNNSNAISTYLREATWLQVQDVLTGQVDRHNENLHVNPDTGHITAFDFDHSFPTMEARPNFASRCPQIIQGKGLKAVDQIGRKGSRNFCMPPVIDTTMQKKIMAIASEKLKTELLPTGLSQDEIEASALRLIHMQQLINGDDDDDMVLEIGIITSTDWKISILLEKGCDSNNLYAFNFFGLQ